MHHPPSPLDRSSEWPDVHPLSLFDTLPVELQIEIFTFCLPTVPCFDSREAPVLISEVSRTWRTLVLSVPKLWSSFEIEVTGSPLQALLHDSDSFIERSTKLWLTRSKNYPLTVSIVHIPVGRTPDDRSVRLLTLLIPEAHRWRSIQFTLPTANMLPLPSHLPSLRSLSLQLKGLWRSEPSVNISTANIPWCQLSRLDLQLEQNNLPNLIDALSILSQTPRLRQCKIRVDSTSDVGADFNNLQLPLLEAFDLQCGNGSNASSLSLARFLHCISMPTLRMLSITLADGSATLWSDCHLFVSFLRRISSTLHYLSLAYLPVSGTDLIYILKPFSHVTHLHLRFSFSDHEHDPITDDLLSSLTFPNSPSMGDVDTLAESPLLPSLISLDLQSNGSKFSNSVLLAMVRSRWKKEANPGDRFSHFGLLSMKPMLREVEKQAQLIHDEGLDISVQTLFVM